MKKSEDCVNLRDCPIFWCTFSVRWRRPRPFFLVRSSKETTWPFWPEGNFLFWQESQCLNNYQNCLIYKNSHWRHLRRLVRGLRRCAKLASLAFEETLIDAEKVWGRKVAGLTNGNQGGPLRAQFPNTWDKKSIIDHRSVSANRILLGLQDWPVYERESRGGFWRVHKHVVLYEK